MEDAKELTGWKKVSQFIYCAGLLFLHSEQTPFHSIWACDWGGLKGKQWNALLKTTIEHICFVPTSKVHLSTCVRTTCPRPASVPHSESGYSISLESGCGPLCCCEAKALTHVCLWTVYPSSWLGLCLPMLAVYVFPFTLTLSPLF